MDIIVYLICLVLAFCIWMYVIGTENEEYEYTFTDVSVMLDGIYELQNERGLSILNGYETKVSITVKGHRSDIIKYTEEDIFARVNLESLSAAGEYSLEVIADLPNGNITHVSTYPSKINVLVDETESKNIPLDPEHIVLRYNVADSFTIHTPEPEIESINVTGPKSLLENIAYVGVEYDIGTVTTSVTFKTSVKLFDHAGNEIKNPYLKPDVSEVLVKVKVTAEKMLPLTPDFTANDMDTYDYTITFEPEVLNVIGDPKDITALTELKVKLGNISESGTVTSDKVELGEGVTLVEKNVKIRYTVTKQPKDVQEPLQEETQ